MPLRPRILLALLVAVPAALSAAPAAHAGQPVTSRASLSSGGNQGTGASTTPSVSADGRYIVFSSSAADLVAGDTNARTDIFLRDRTAGVTRRVNVGPGGVQDNGGFADAPVISADGRTVVFRSDATNLAPVGPGRHLFAYDRASGAVRVIAESPPMQVRPFGLDVSADGRRVVYGAGVAGIDQVFTADTVSGAVQPVTQTAAGVAGDGGSFDPVISGDGRWAAFTTAATNLAPVNPNGFREVLGRDLSSGAFSRLSLGAGDATPNLHSSTPALSADGCRAAFFSSANNLVAADNGISPAIQPKVFVRDRCNADTEVASLSNAGTLGIASVPISMSADGCSVAFLATSIVVPAPAGGSAAVLRDRCTGTTSRLDLSSAGEPGAGGVTDLALSATGRYAVFVTSSAGLVPGDSNNTFDVFLRDRGTNTPPVAAATLTQTGRRVVVDAAASSDPDGPTLTAQISFGDGSPDQTGLIATHDYASGGTFGVGVTVTDEDGVSATKAFTVTVPDPAVVQQPAPPPLIVGSAPPAPRVPLAAAPLVLDAVGLSRRSFSVVAKGGKPKGRRGASLTLRLSDPATVTLTYERARPGRKAKGRCVARGRRGPKCTIYTASGTTRLERPAGTSTTPITGRIGARVLGRGAYRLRVEATSPDGRVAPAKTVTFSIGRS